MRSTRRLHSSPAFGTLASALLVVLAAGCTTDPVPVSEHRLAVAAADSPCRQEQNLTPVDGHGPSHDTGHSPSTGHGPSPHHHDQPGGTNGDSSPPPTVIPSAGPALANVIVRAAIRDGVLTPELPCIDVVQGQSVRLEIGSDRPVAMRMNHLGMQASATPQHPAVIAFTAEHAGDYDLETLDPAAKWLLRVRVR